MTGRRLHVAALLIGTGLALGAPAGAAVIGRCRFDTGALAFAGSPAAQAACLLRPVAKWGRVAPGAASLPPTLAGRIGRPARLDAAKLRQQLAAAGLSEQLGDLGAPVSQSASGVRARYFVIHDTSSPWLGAAPFPGDLDRDAGINRLAGYAGANAVAHYFVNRPGEVLRGHDFGVPWRATKLEKAVGTASRGLFLHIELLQPRRRDPTRGASNDALAPDPGFSAAQYDRLALLYVSASLRAGTWLIPGFHAAIDEGQSDGHDDPQNFDLAAFDAALGALVAKAGG